MRTGSRWAGRGQARRTAIGACLVGVTLVLGGCARPGAGPDRGAAISERFGGGALPAAPGPAGLVAGPTADPSAADGPNGPNGPNSPNGVPVTLPGVPVTLPGVPVTLPGVPVTAGTETAPSGGVVIGPGGLPAPPGAPVPPVPVPVPPVPFPFPFPFPPVAGAGR